MCKSGLISVVIPVYNAGKFLGECIESVLKQTYASFELLLIDDGSRDNSYSICEEYANKDTRIKVFHNSNHGVSYTRNFGIDQSTGEFLCFVDADDIILPDYLQRLYAAMEEDQNTDAVYCGFQLLYDSKVIKRSPRIAPGAYTFKDLSSRAIDDGTLSGILFGSVWCSLYRTSLIREHRIHFVSSIKKNEDGLFNLHMLPFARGITVLDYEGYLYRQWKTGRAKEKTFIISPELDKATTAIAETCKDYENFEVQQRRRNVSVIFWNLLALENCSDKLPELCRKVKNYVSQSSLFTDYKELEFSAISRYKRVFISLLYQKHYFSFVVLLKYVKPILEKFLNH